MPTTNQPDKVSGPASYFPSIEKKYGRPIAEWKQLIRASGITKHMELVNTTRSIRRSGNCSFDSRRRIRPELE